MARNSRALLLRIGRNVRQLRLHRGWSQEELAERVGNTDKHIGQIERGQVNVGVNILTAIAAQFSVAVTDLLGGQNDIPLRDALIETELEQIARALEALRRMMRAQRVRRRTRRG
jgi:transcriptional regulator with XRE-family HTH domain